MIAIALSPQFKLFLSGDDFTNHKDLESSFQKGNGYGLLALDRTTAIDEDSFHYWKDFSRLYLSLFSATPDLSMDRFIDIDLPELDLGRFVLTVPSMKGAEYVSAESLLALWDDLQNSLRQEVIEFGKDIPSYFAARHSDWNLLGRVCFHLAENKSSIEFPFAFMATYAHKMSQEGKTQHLPLVRALEIYSGPNKKNMLLRLLSPLHRAASESPFIKSYLDSGELYHPIAWTANEAHQFLSDISIFEKAGVAVRVPNWWKRKQSNGPQVTIRLGEKNKSTVGASALLDFSMSVTVADTDLNEKELRELLDRSDQLVFLKGKWIEVDKEKLDEILLQLKRVSKSVKNGSVTFTEGMRLLAGVSGKMSDPLDDKILSQTRVISGKWLTETLNHLRSPDHDLKREKNLQIHLKADLRHYQSQGVRWLTQLNQMQIGGVLADDMGLGKTIQIISLLLLKKHFTQEKFISLLVVPASLIGNWKGELTKFAPTLKYWIAHPSADGSDLPDKDYDLVITTFGSLIRMTWHLEMEWDLLLADEAQAIKNPDSKQTKAIKALKSHHRIALTGTPVENHLSDLWSLFDFVSPGLLGSAKEFETFIKKKKKIGENPFSHLRQLVQPYMLRRLKTDKSVINDLPDKTEMKSYCHLSKVQIALYQKSVETLAREIEETEGIKRKGVILSYLMRFKQICNHPSQFLKETDFNPATSGKFLRLKEICEVIVEKQEKVLIFTQFREMTEPLHDFLETLFGRKGLVLSGETAVKKRTEMVKAFQEDDGPPFFVLSLKAGGTGLNLTAASHVIHFDRWWNPAVENQATDRAFRIGQKRNVIVHKFVCSGTLEEKIDLILESKQNMSNEILDGSEGPMLTELGNSELIKIVSLDIKSALI